MKSKILKKCTVILIVIVLLCITIESKAETYTFTFTVNPTEVTAEPGDTVTINLGIADIDQTTDGIHAIQGNVVYDESIFEKVEIITNQSNWSVTFNQLTDSDRKGRFVISNITGTKTTQTVAQLKATIKSGTTASLGEINLNDVYSSYGSTDTEKSNKIVKVKINQKNNKVSRR